MVWIFDGGEASDAGARALSSLGFGCATALSLFSLDLPKRMKRLKEYTPRGKENPAIRLTTARLAASRTLPFSSGIYAPADFEHRLIQ
jgi:hypothetical protein